MKKIKFTARDGKSYLCPMDLEAVELEQFINLMQIEKEMPAVLKAIIDEKDPKVRVDMLEQITPVTNAREILPYKARVVAELCKMPLTEILDPNPKKASMSVSDLDDLYANCMNAFNKFEADPEAGAFVFKGVTYKLPAKFMQGSTVIEYMEAAQYQAYFLKLNGGAWEALPFVIAILARPEREPYNEEAMLLRAEEFKKLPANIALNVSFFLTRQSAILSRSLGSYMLAQALGRLRRARQS